MNDPLSTTTSIPSRPTPTAPPPHPTSGSTLSRRGLLAAAGVAAVAVPTGALFGRPASAQAAWPLVARDEIGCQTTTVQHLLRHRGQNVSVDGVFGSGTESALRSFQSANGLTQSGQCDTDTWSSLVATVAQGTNNHAVRAIQTQMNRHGHQLVVDGAFGPATNAAVRAFQSSKPELGTDGVAGSATWQTSASTASGENFRLNKTADSPVIDQLKGLLTNHWLDTVVDSANRDASRCSSGATNFQIGFCWNSGDNNTSDWWTQATTTTADATPAGTYAQRTVVAVAWYYQPDDAYRKGSRISFVNWGNTSSPAYRHVLLVEPFNNNGVPDFRPVRVHAGGMFWYHHYIYVADTRNGFRVFDVRDFLRVSTGNNNIIGRQSDGSYHGYNYLYVLPQKFRYMHTTTGGVTDLRFSFVGLDRTSAPDSLVAGEYENDGSQTRLVRWPLNPDTMLLQTDADGYARASAAHTVGVQRMQGVVSINNRFLMSRSNGSGTRGDLVRYLPGGSPVYHTGHLPAGPEDLSYWAARDQLWTNSEYPTRRNVYAIRASAY